MRHRREKPEGEEISVEMKVMAREWEESDVSIRDVDKLKCVHSFLL